MNETKQQKMFGWIAKETERYTHVTTRSQFVIIQMCKTKHEIDKDSEWMACITWASHVVRLWMQCPMPDARFIEIIIIFVQTTFCKQLHSLVFVVCCTDFFLFHFILFHLVCLFVFHFSLVWLLFGCLSFYFTGRLEEQFSYHLLFSNGFVSRFMFHVGAKAVIEQIRSNSLFAHRVRANARLDTKIGIKFI